MAELNIANADDLSAESTARRFQMISLVLAGISFGLLFIQGSDIWSSLIKIGSRYYSGILSITLLLLLAHLVARRVYEITKKTPTSSDDPMGWYKNYFSPLRLADIICGVVAVIATISCFTVYKTKVVGSQGYLYDDLFVAWDQALFVGRDPWVLTHALFPSPAFTKWIDFLYHPTFLALLISYMICIVLQSRPALRYTFMLSYLASFVFLGMVMAYQLSAAGPVFDGYLFGDGTTFGPLTDTLIAQDEVAGPFVFLLGKEYLLHLYEAGASAAAGGISAMPSMHVVLAFLCAIGLWHVSRVLGILATLYALIIWLGSVHLGWHYFVDGLVGLIALVIIWTICGRAMGLYGKPQVIRATT
jgi:hypothetical protein